MVTGEPSGAPGRSSRARAHRRISDETAARIRGCHADGLSLRQTARQVGVSAPDLSRWSKREGLCWLPVPAVAATQAERYRARRTALAEAILSDAANIRERIWESSTEYFATADGIQAVTTDTPTARAVADLTAAVERLIRSADHLAGDVPAIEEQRSMLGRLQSQISEAIRGT